MRTLCLASVLTALTTAATAQGLQPSAGRILGDPAFLPISGQLEGGFEYNYTANLYDSGGTSPLNDPQHAFDSSRNSFLPSLSYGITNDISVSASFGWGNDRLQNDYIFSHFVYAPVAARQAGLSIGSISTGPISTGLMTIHPIPPISIHPIPIRRLTLVSMQEHVDTRSIGAEDPVFGATWRVIDERAAPISLDLSARYAPDIFAARAQGEQQTGTIAAGSQRGEIEAAVSRVERLFTLRGYATFGYNGRGDVLLPYGGDNTERPAPHPDYAAGLQTEVRPFPWVALNSGAGIAYTPQYDTQFYYSDVEESSETVHTGRTIAPYVALVAPLLPDRLVGIVGYQHDFIGDSKLDHTYGDERFYDHASNMIYARLLFTLGH